MLEKKLDVGVSRRRTRHMLMGACRHMLMAASRHMLMAASLARMLPATCRIFVCRCHRGIEQDKARARETAREGGYADDATTMCMPVALPPLPACPTARTPSGSTRPAVPASLQYPQSHTHSHTHGTSKDTQRGRG